MDRMRLNIQVLAPPQTHHELPSVGDRWFTAVVDANARFFALWKVAESTFKANYTEASAWEYAFKKMTTAENYDISLDSIVSEIFHPSTDPKTWIVKIHQVSIHRDISIPLGSHLRPAPKRPAPEMLREIAKRRREEERYGAPLRNINPDCAVLSAEDDKRPTDPPVANSRDQDGFAIPQRPLHPAYNDASYTNSTPTPITERSRTLIRPGQAKGHLNPGTRVVSSEDADEENHHAPYTISTPAPITEHPRTSTPPGHAKAHSNPGTRLVSSRDADDKERLETSSRPSPSATQAPSRWSPTEQKAFDDAVVKGFTVAEIYELNIVPGRSKKAISHRFGQVKRILSASNKWPDETRKIMGYRQNAAGEFELEKSSVVRMSNASRASNLTQGDGSLSRRLDHSLKEAIVVIPRNEGQGFEDDSESIAVVPASSDPKYKVARPRQTTIPFKRMKGKQRVVDPDRPSQQLREIKAGYRSASGRPLPSPAKIDQSASTSNRAVAENGSPQPRRDDKMPSSEQFPYPSTGQGVAIDANLAPSQNKQDGSGDARSAQAQLKRESIDPSVEQLHQEMHAASSARSSDKNDRTDSVLRGLVQSTNNSTQIKSFEPSQELVTPHTRTRHYEPSPLFCTPNTPVSSSRPRERMSPRTAAIMEEEEQARRVHDARSHRFISTLWKRNITRPSPDEPEVLAFEPADEEIVRFPMSLDGAAEIHVHEDSPPSGPGQVSEKASPLSVAPGDSQSTLGSARPPFPSSGKVRSAESTQSSHAQVSPSRRRGGRAISRSDLVANCEQITELSQRDAFDPQVHVLEPIPDHPRRGTGQDRDDRSLISLSDETASTTSGSESESESDSEEQDDEEDEDYDEKNRKESALRKPGSEDSEGSGGEANKAPQVASVPPHAHVTASVKPQPRAPRPRHNPHLERYRESAHKWLRDLEEERRAKAEKQKKEDHIGRKICRHYQVPVSPHESDSSLTPSSSSSSESSDNDTLGATRALKAR